MSTQLTATGFVTNIENFKNSKKVLISTGNEKNDDGSFKKGQSISMIVAKNAKDNKLYESLEKEEIKKGDAVEMTGTIIKNAQGYNVNFANDAKQLPSKGEKLNMGVTFETRGFLNHHQIKKNSKTGEEFSDALVSDDKNSRNVTLNAETTEKIKNGEINKGDLITAKGNVKYSTYNKDGQVKVSANFNAKTVEINKTKQEIQEIRAEKSKSEQQQKEPAKTAQKKTTKKTKKAATL